MTSISRRFGDSELNSVNEIITLEKNSDKTKSSLIVISNPDSAMIRVNGESKGFTPFSSESEAPGERDLLVSASGFSDYQMKVNLVAGYKLILNIKLAQDSPNLRPTNTEPEPEDTEAISSTPIPSKSSSPRSTVTPTSVSLKKPYVTITDTPTGWLRVRAEANTQSEELGKVYPGENYAFLDENTGWYKISFETNKEGWISSSYAKKVE
ncbi:MAG: SH3 domain-containing protein [Patescibacteria group bacterium]|nr:SH3 domain-containing protein [Patescibacteria group bacterium]